ncbi:MAG: hypothetical protein J0L73_04615 [Verrucomicrobia bacterium]|nr:hypothetical protein [Verrucomicrobiota bacterium]
MEKKRILYFLALVPLFGLGGLFAAQPEWYNGAVKEVLYLREARPLPKGRYTGNQLKINISTQFLAPAPTPLELEFPAGTVFEDVTLTVRDRITLNLRGCILRRVALQSGPASTINLESCVLETCYVDHDRAIYRSANGAERTVAEVHANFGVPKISMKDCIVADTTLSSPYLGGITATRSTFLSCVVEADAEDGKQKSERYIQCAFTGSKISSVDVLLNSSQCVFNNCECADALTANAGGNLVEAVTLPLAWEKGKTVLPPATANGKIRFEPAAAMPETGSAKSHQWEGGHLKVSDLAEADGASQRLQDVWKLTDFKTYMANKGSATQPAAGAQPNGTSANATITGTPAAAGVSFQSRINQVNGLLISQLSSGGEAGQVTRMSLTALPSLGESPSTLKFNQDVGESMGKALNEVSKFSQLRHGGWPVGHSLEIGFEDKYIGKDGPSAAVACALLLEAAITGKKWDPAFAVTGDMNADGSVQPIGGVQAKIRGATKGSCKLVGVPVKNEKSVQDLLVLEGPAPLVGITVFGIKTFDDALLLAGTERPPALQNALTDFDNMRTVMMRDPSQIVPLLRTPHAAQRLQALLTAAPNCYSAKYLLLYLQGRAPRSLSIGGSIEAAQSSADSIVSSIDHDVDTNMSSLKGDELGTSLYRLRNLRPRLDQRVWPYVDNLVAYGEVIRGALLNPVRSGARYVDLVGKANKAASGAKAAYDKLINDVQVREELGL